MFLDHVMIQQTPFCLLEQEGIVRFYSGECQELTSLSSLKPGTTHLPTLSLVPFCQIREREGFEAKGDEKILSIKPDIYIEVGNIDQFLQETIAFSGFYSPSNQPKPDMDDAEFVRKVKYIQDQVIAKGEGSNFVLSRKYEGQFQKSFGVSEAICVFRKLLVREQGTYMRYLFFNGQRFFICASPERQISVFNHIVSLNPISGTLAKNEMERAKDPLQVLVSFIKDPKETMELIKVVDEEMKIMAVLCPSGGKVSSLNLKEMSKVIHTEYELKGPLRSGLTALDAFRQSMFCPTLIGGPLANASQIVSQVEESSRRYYGGSLIVHSLDEKGSESFDSCISIRMAEINRDGTYTIQAGATIVHDSNPVKEARETERKSAAMVSILSDNTLIKPSQLLTQDMMREISPAMKERDQIVGNFWKQESPSVYRIDSKAQPKSMALINGGDDFCFMIAHILGKMGLKVSIYNSDTRAEQLTGSGGVILGPGPGNPKDHAYPKIKSLRRLAENYLQGQEPLIGVCLGHQIISDLLGLELVQLDRPLQGVKKVIPIKGKEHEVGFYNSFVSRGEIRKPFPSRGSLDKILTQEGDIAMLLGVNLSTAQFHPESVMTLEGHEIIRLMYENAVQKSF